MLRICFFILSVLLFAESTNISLFFKNGKEVIAEIVINDESGKDSKGNDNTSEKQMDKYFPDSFLKLERGIPLISSIHYMEYAATCAGYYLIPFMPPEITIG